ncbi:MAG: hypothetical protein IT306_23700 [Chloroflexi bacterium]|nr:hypothetical protein [Chloroflexota bacterium]
MTVIAQKALATVRGALDRTMRDDVELALFTCTRGRTAHGQPAGPTCARTRELMQHLVSLSDRLQPTMHAVGDDPAMATGYNVRAVPTVIIRKRAPEYPPSRRATTCDLCTGRATTRAARCVCHP